ncbi:MAG: geranylgeranyl reductase family protein [Candidatus Thorarchaeota archaeon]
MTKYDVVIVGSGPAGSTAGYCLALQGLDVLILEKEKHPREKICGGALTEKTIALNKEVFGDGCDKLKEMNIIDYSSHEYEIILKNGENKKRSSDNGYYFIKRKTYDNYLVEKALDKGISMIENNKVDKLNIRDKIIPTKNCTDIKYDYLISADGVNSIIRNKYFFNNINELKEWYYNIGIGMQIIIDRENISPQIYHPQMYFSEIKEGYAWVFPNKTHMIIGLGGSLKDNRDIKEKFFKFLNNFELKKKPKIVSALLPFGFYLDNLVKNDILLTGDSAGLANPFTGEGIFYAQKSGLLAAESIIQDISEGNSLSSYSERIKTEITSTFQFSTILRMIYFLA